MSSQELFGDPNTYSQGIWKTRVLSKSMFEEENHTDALVSSLQPLTLGYMGLFIRCAMVKSCYIGDGHPTFYRESL